MAKLPFGHSIPLLGGAGPGDGHPLYRRLYGRIREGVLQGAIPPGTRLPSARTIAREERVSRNTVEAALAQLRAEGFVVRKVGAGTWVRDDIRSPSLPVKPPRAIPEAGRRSGESTSLLSQRGRQIASAGREPAPPEDLLFSPSTAALGGLPLTTWNRVARRYTRGGLHRRLLGTLPPGGLPELREAIAAYLHMKRGVRCTADRVVVVNSAQQAIDLVTRVMLDDGDRVWLEDPGYVAARWAFVAAGARPVPISVDDEGIDVAQGRRRGPDARLVYVTPSHQYPMGVTLSLARRLGLLAWAEEAGAWIVEDDYDSELRYDGNALASMQGIEPSGRVLYVGTFNKILFPGVRAAYLVLPEELVDVFERAKAISDGFTSPFVQAVLADFIGEGHFAAHLRRARDVCRERRDAFLRAASKHLPAGVGVGPAEAGVHLVLRLPGGTDDRALSRRAFGAGLAVPALSQQAMESDVRGVLVHYGVVAQEMMESGTERLGKVLRTAGPS